MKIKKGDCFHSAAMFILNQDQSTPFVMVNGHVTGQTDTTMEGKVFGHAWVECDDIVIDTETELVIHKECYYKAGKIDPESCISYTYEETFERCVENQEDLPLDLTTTQDEIDAEYLYETYNV